MIAFLLLSFLPFLFFLFAFFQQKYKKRIVPPSQLLLSLFIVVIALCIGLFPVEFSSDKERYVFFYNNIQYGFSYINAYRDAGWYFIVKIGTLIFSRNWHLFFILLSFIYTLSYVVFAKYHFKNYWVFFVIMAFGCVDFSSYGYNTVRNGLAIAMCLVCLGFDKKFWLKVMLLLLAVSIHKSMLLPISAYLLTSKLKRGLYVYMLWIICFLLSVVNLDLSNMFLEVGFEDERIERYAATISGERETRYNTGYRIDFLIYSIIPIVISFYYIKAKHIVDRVFLHLFYTYLFVNAIWLLVIRMAATNRIAYLSWVLIPYLTIFPIISNPHKFSHPRKLLFLIMGTFIGVGMLLSVKSFLLESFD